MKISIETIQKLSNQILGNFGFNSEEAEYITENLLEGALTGKSSHGFIRIPWIKKLIDSKSISITEEKISIPKETPVSLLVDGKNKTGFYVANKALNMGFAKVTSSGICVVGTTNTAPTTGLIGLYARKAAEKDLILIAFNNSAGGLVPHGSIKDLWGTNPLTVGIPTEGIPVILDMAASQITWGHLLLAKAQGKELPQGAAIDGKGEPTTDPASAIEGGLLPIAGHKGSGLAFIVELLGGALTASRTGGNVPGGWGSLMILIDPNIIRDLEDFKRDVTTAITELKGSPKMKGFDEIYFPGEQSQKRRLQALEEGQIDIDDQLYKSLNEL